MKYLKIFLIIMVVFTFSGCNQDEIDSLKDQIAQLEDENATLRSDKENLKDEIDEMDSMVDSLSWELDIERDTTDSLRSEIEMYEDVTGNTNGFVYITKTGTKYHRPICHHLSDSSYYIMYTTAKQKGYTPCMDCSPY